jgi:hypothetical protein
MISVDCFSEDRWNARYLPLSLASAGYAQGRTWFARYAGARLTEYFTRILFGRPGFSACVMLAATVPLA